MNLHQTCASGAFWEDEVIRLVVKVQAPSVEF